jgi:chromatin modification-related protein EAF6
MKNNNQDDNNKILFEINQKKQEIRDDIDKIEKCIFDLETKYLEITQHNGNIIKGWEQTFNTKSKINAQTIQNTLIKRQKFSSNERIFSQSSCNNPYLNENASSLNILGNVIFLSR